MAASMTAFAGGLLTMSFGAPVRGMICYRRFDHWVAGWMATLDDAYNATLRSTVTAALACRVGCYLTIDWPARWLAVRCYGAKIAGNSAFGGAVQDPPPPFMLATAMGSLAFPTATVIATI